MHFILQSALRTPQSALAGILAVLTTLIIATSFASGQKTPVDALIDSGYKLMESSNYDGAIRDFTKAISLDTRSAEAYIARGRARGLKEDYAGAIADYSKAIVLDPKRKEPYMDRGVLLHMQKKYDAAIADFTKYIARDYKGLEGYLQRGRALFAKRDLNRALAEFSALIKMSPSHTAAYINRGLIKIELKQYDLAAADFTKLIEIDASNSSYYEYRSLAYRKAGKIELALDDGLTAQASTQREFEEGTTAHLDELVDLKPDELEEGLFEIAVLANRVQKDWQVLLIGYGGRVGPANEALSVLEAAKSQLTSFGVASLRIATMDGGFREKRTVEVYLIPAGGETPEPSPTVDPSEVKSPRPAPLVKTKKVGPKKR